MMESLRVYPTFVDLMGDRAQLLPDQRAFIFLKNGEAVQSWVTYRDLDQQARAIATYLTSCATMGDRAVLIYPYDAGLEFIAAFLGCLYAGIVAVPSHPPRNQSSLEDLRGRFISSGARLLLTSASLQPRLKRQLKTSDAEDTSIQASIQWFATDTLSISANLDWQRPEIHPDTLAFLQYTSGSTGLPKGVMITHGCLLQNQELLKHAFGHTEKLVGIGWLPLFHDMGLIGNVLQTLYVGTACVLMSPLAFVQKPVRWLQAISTYQGTTSGGPNFAYDLLCRHVTEQQCEGLNLSHWDVAFSGAEPVRSETLDAFTTKFSPYGFRREAFYPCYGMAEATLFITGGKKAKSPHARYVDAIALEENQVVETNAHYSHARALVGCGHPWLDYQITIAHPETCYPCPPNQVGEIWVSGAGLGKGYWNESDKTMQTFQAYLAGTGNGPFLRTGDLGFLQGGELFITGRLHDVLVFWGLNHYPEHIEHTVETCHSGFQPNGGAAFAVSVNGSDRLVIVQEVKPRYRDRVRVNDVVESIRWTIFDQHFVDVYGIALVKPGGIPKTSSGKIQRRVCRDQYLAGELEILDEWRSPPTTISDIPSLMRRYLNPATHIRRYWTITKRVLQRR